MKSVMSCDHVFDALTRGPFPAGGGDDEAIDLHLGVCHGCRQLAEALRPAVHLFHEAMTEEEEVGLPTYLGRCEDSLGSPRFLPESGVSPRLAARQPTVAVPDEVAGRGRVAAAWAGGCAGLGVSLAIWLTIFVLGPHEVDQPVPRGSLASADGEIASLDSSGRALLASFNLPLSCFSVSGELVARTRGTSIELVRFASADQLADIACCTRCHGSSGTSPVSRNAVATITASCAACHRPPRTSADDHQGLIGKIWRASPLRAC